MTVIVIRTTIVNEILLLPVYYHYRKGMSLIRSRRLSRSATSALLKTGSKCKQTNHFANVAA